MPSASTAASSWSTREADAVRTAAGVLAEAPNWLLFSPDGKTVVSTGLDGTVTLWDVGSATPRETLRGHSASAAQPVFSPDGRTLYTVEPRRDGDRLGRRAATAGSARPFRFTHEPGHSKSSRIGTREHLASDGRLIAVGLKERGIGLWDARGLIPSGRALAAAPAAR